MDDSDDDENSPSGFVLAGNTEKSGDEVQQILGKCQSAQEFLGAASRCLEAVSLKHSFPGDHSRHAVVVYVVKLLCLWIN